MRQLLSLAALAVIFVNGCRSCTTMPAPIVGDSMSHWGATENSSQHCQPQTVDFRGALAKLFRGAQAGAGPCETCPANKFDDFGAACCGECGDANCLNCCGGDSSCCQYPAAGQPGNTLRQPPVLTPRPMPCTPISVAGMPGMAGAGRGQSGFGCGGQGCAGRCGGRCAAARARANQGMGPSSRMPHPLGDMHRAAPMVSVTRGPVLSRVR